MKIFVHVRGKVIDLECGDGTQLVPWLGSAAMVRYDDTFGRRFGSPVSIQKEGGIPCDPEARVCDVLEDNQHVFAELEDSDLGDLYCRPLWRPMISGSQVYQVSRAVARGDGDWADVPRCVREAIVLTLRSYASGSATPASAGQSPRTPPPPRRHSLPPVLSEGVVQRSVQTFEDGAWVRDEAVRSYAQFHNTVETLHTGMAGQLRALWRTGMQLSPRILGGVREEFNLSPTDAIPDGVPLAAEDVARIAQQEAVLEELVRDLQALRDSSVRFAAHWLTDREKMAMGANPAYLQPDAIDAEMWRRHRSPPAPARAATPPRADSRRRRRRHQSLRSAVSGHADADADAVVGSRGVDDADTRNDPQLRELRRQYVARLSELAADAGAGGGAAGPHRSRDSPRRSSHHSRRRSSSSNFPRETEASYNGDDDGDGHRSSTRRGSRR